MTRSRPLRGRSALVAAGVAAAVLGTGALTPADADPDDKRVRLEDGLVTPLSLAVQPDGTVWVSQNFAGQLVRRSPSGATRVVVNAGEGREVGAVSWHQGVTTYAISQGNNERGVLRRIRGNRDVTFADIGAAERRLNPDGGVTYGFTDLDPTCEAEFTEEAPATYSGVVETHPFATTSSGSGARTVTYVADAGANAIFAVSNNRRVRAVGAVPGPVGTMGADEAEQRGFPECAVGESFRYESVPTDIEVGPGGALFVTTLPGGPEDGSGPAASVYKIDPRTGSMRRVLTGLVSATGLAVAPNRDIYVNQLFTGEIRRFPGGKGAGVPWKIAPLPGDIEFSGRYLWATTNVLPDGPPDGQVHRWVPNQPPVQP